MRAILSIAALLACCRCAFALDPSLDVSQYAHTAWKIREGFATGTIHEIAQTPDGYLWLATESGLLRFDGVRTVAWQPPRGERLPSNDIRNLIAGRDGTLWLGTAKGLASWKDGKLTQYPELAGRDVYTLLQDREGAVWAAGSIWEAGFSAPAQLCAIRNGDIHCYGSDGRFGFGVTAAYEDSKGNLWLGAGNGIWHWKPGPPKHYPLPALMRSGLPGLIFTRHALIEGDHEALLIAGYRGIRQLVRGKVEPYRFPSPPPEFREPKLLRDRKGGLWIGTLDAGLLHVHQGRMDVFTDSDGLSGNSVEGLFEDREGSIWVSTLNGLDRFREYAIPTISVKQGLSSGFVVCVLAARDGSVWLGTSDGLNRWDNGQVTIYRNPGAERRGVLGGVKSEHNPGAKVREVATHELPDNYVGSLFQDRQGRIWISTLQGLAYFENGKFTRLSDPYLKSVSPIAGNNAGDLWVTNSNQGLFRLREGRVVEQFPWAGLRVRGSLSNPLVTDLHGGLWLASWNGGVVYFKDGRVRASYGPEDGLGGGRVNALKLDPDSTLWAATDGGLSRIRGGHVATLTSKNGLPCDAVHDVIDDDAHSYWLYMACGLARVARSELYAWAADPARTIQTTVFDTSDGIRSHAGVYNFGPRAAKTKDGKLWFLPLDGVSVVDPRHLPYNKVPPPVHIEKVTADLKAHDPAAHGNLRLPPLIRDLSIEYTALSFVEPEKVRFRFKLEGQDKDWREVVNERKVHYSNLAPGNYRFRVIASNNSGVWNEQGATLDLFVAPAFYQTNWFRASCVAAFLGLLWGLYRLRIHRLRCQEKQLRDVINAVPANIWSTSPDGALDFVNQRWQELTGLPPEDALGWNWASVIHPEDVPRYIAEWQAALKNGQPMETEVRVRRADGEYRRLFVRNVPLRDKHGKIVKWYGTSVDVEDRKRAEEALLQAQADLAHTNRVSTLGELATSLAHELKQPIAAAITNAKTSLRWLVRDEPDLQEAREAIMRIVKDGTRAADIIDHLRSFYKKDVRPERELVDVNELAREMLILLRSEANRYSISMRAELAEDLPKSKADRVQLQQVFMNLMLNGIEAMKDSGGELTVNSQLIRDGQIMVSVSDSGVGLPNAHAEQIFNAFFTTKPHGSGMGLTISRSIVESHGGRLWATRNPGRGATFQFTLPAAAEELKVSAE